MRKNDKKVNTLEKLRGLSCAFSWVEYKNTFFYVSRTFQTCCQTDQISKKSKC